MSLIEKSPEKRREELIQYSKVMCLALVVFGGVGYWREKICLSLLFFVAALLFYCAGLFCPNKLDPVERAWLKFAEKLSIVMNFLIVVVLFIGTTFMGLILRLMGKDLLSMRFERDKTSYWVKVEPDGPGSRP